MPNNSPHYLTIQELSRRVGLSVSQLRRLVKRGAIPSYQPGGKGGKLLFSPDALEAAPHTAMAMADRTPRTPRSGRRPQWQTE